MTTPDSVSIPLSILRPLLKDMADAEDKHGPIPIEIPASNALLAECEALEHVARLDLTTSIYSGPLAILCEEVGEAARAETPEALIGELLQVAGVALRWATQLQEGATATHP
jgi:hypothetical protein